MEAIQQLTKFRKSPGFELLADSVLLLKTLQLDMDCPTPLPAYIHKQLNPDHLHITFNTETPLIPERSLSGVHLPWRSTVKIPNGSEIHTYVPHGYLLADPKLHRVVSKKVGPSSLSNTAGTSTPGRLKNYTVSKFQSATDETCQDIVNIGRTSNTSPFNSQLPSLPWIY